MRSCVYHITPTMAIMKPMALFIDTADAKKRMPRPQMMMVLVWPTTWYLPPRMRRALRQAARRLSAGFADLVGPALPTYVTALVLASIMADEKFMGAARAHEIRIHIWETLATAGPRDWRQPCHAPTTAGHPRPARAHQDAHG